MRKSLLSIKWKKENIILHNIGIFRPEDNILEYIVWGNMINSIDIVICRMLFINWLMITATIKIRVFYVKKY